MCIKILSDGLELKYDAAKPLEQQLLGCQKVVINYEPKDPDMDSFLSEMERLCKNGITCDVSIDISHSNHINGAKAHKQLKRLRKDLDLNEAIKLLVNLHSATDIKLSEMAEFCKR